MMLASFCSVILPVTCVKPPPDTQKPESTDQEGREPPEAAITLLPFRSSP